MVANLPSCSTKSGDANFANFSSKKIVFWSTKALVKAYLELFPEVSNGPPSLVSSSD